MKIFVKTLTGERHTLDVESSTTIRAVRTKLRGITDVAEDAQKLLFAGKSLEDGRELRDYNVSHESTLHLLVRGLDFTHNIPEETTFGSTASSNTVIDEWERKAHDGDFDVDLHIVDPQAHFDRLDRLEDLIILNSEFYHCRGSYDLSDDRVPPFNTRESLINIPPWMWLSLQSAAQPSALPPKDDFEAMWQDEQKMLASLWKSYLILCRVLDSFSVLEKAGFSKDFFSFLLRRSVDTAEIVKIFPLDRLNSVKSSLENVCGHVLENIAVADSQRYLTDLVEEPCLSLLGDLGCNFPGGPRPKSSVLALLRATMLLFDLALVSYVGSHGSRFNDKYMTTSSQQITVLGKFGDTFSFRCSLQRLACLNGFLDSRLVWVFELYSEPLLEASIAPAPTPVSLYGTLAEKQPSKGILLLTTMDAFGDLWGPVWSIPTSDGNSIKQYNVSKGVICPISERRNTRVDGAIPCHWYSWASFYGFRISKLFKRPEELGLASQDLLLIGSGIRENLECDYTLDDFEENYEDQMNVIGTSPETWRTDSRSLSLNFSKIFGIAVTGTQKKVPQTTLKQHILDRWSNKADRANPAVLNMYLGLEISHCTGNARRLPLKSLFLMSTVQPLLERQQPGWTETPWGMAFLKALKSPYEQDIFDVWSRYRSNRTDMADLVCCVLDLLDTTGYSNDRFTAGFFRNNSESALTLDHRADDWAIILEDSNLMAVFPVVNKICLEFHTPNHSTATHGESKQPTILKTQIAIEKDSKDKTPCSHERIKLKPYGRTLRTVDGGSSHINLFSLETDLNRTMSSLGNLLGRSPAAGVERREQAHSDTRLQFYVRGSDISQRRTEVSLKKAKIRIARLKVPTTNMPNNLGGLLQPTTQITQSGYNQAIPTNTASVEVRRAMPTTTELTHRRIVDDIGEYLIYDGDSDEDVVWAPSGTGVGMSHDESLRGSHRRVEGIAAQDRTPTSPRLRRRPNFTWDEVREPPI